MQGTSAALAAYYAPDRWVPHITIGFGDVTPGVAAAIVRQWAGCDLAWEVRIDGLAFISVVDGLQQVVHRAAWGRTA